MSISASAPLLWRRGGARLLCASCGRDRIARFVQQLADERTLLLAERFHLLAPSRDAAAAAEITDAHRVERLLVRRRGDLAQRGVAEFFERVGHWKR